MLKKTCLLAATLLAVTQLMAQQNATMITKTVNGAVERTDISEIDRITFTDATFNLNVNGYRILEADELTWPEDRLLPFFMAPASTLRSLDMSAAKLSGEERVMFCALQGLINRTCPRIILYNHNEEPQTTWPTAHSLKTSAISTSMPYTLVTAFKDEIKGLVLYSTERSEHYANLATTIAGIESLLPVTAEVRAKLMANGMDFPIIEDISELTMTTAVC